MDWLESPRRDTGADDGGRGGRCEAPPLPLLLVEEEARLASSSMAAW